MPLVASWRKKTRSELMTNGLQWRDITQFFGSALLGSLGDRGGGPGGGKWWWW